jgi:predicted amidohydrolase YtcJ
LRRPNDMLQIIGIKTFLDGGMLTGSAYMRQPWGVSKIYSITDPDYRGVLFIPRERLVQMVDATTAAGLQFTAHSVGDGAVHALIDAYEEVGRKHPIRDSRPCITHCNFMSAEAIDKMERLGISADIQPAWLYLDTRTLMAQFGNDRLRYFQPLRSLFKAGLVAGGGSDHMQKIGSMRSINPYNPFLGIATAVTRNARWFDGALHPEERLTREQAIRFYTMNNAYLLFLEKQLGSLEPGKFADMIVLDRDILECPEDAIAQTQVLRTWVGGKQVYSK